MRRWHATPRSPPPPAELKWLNGFSLARPPRASSPTSPAAALKGINYYEVPAAGPADLGLSAVYCTRGVPTIAFLSADDVSSDRHLSHSSFKSLGRRIWILIFFFGLNPIVGFSKPSMLREIHGALKAGSPLWGRRYALRVPWKSSRAATSRVHLF